MRANPKNLIQVTDGENASSFYTASRRGVGYFLETLINNESICVATPAHQTTLGKSQEEMRAAAVRTMVAMGEECQS